MSRWPLLGPALGLLAGIASALLGAPLPSLALVLLPLVLCRRAAPLAFAVAGWLAATSARSAPLAAPDGIVPLRGRVDSAPDLLGDRVRLRLALEDGRGVELWATAPPDPVALGDALALRASLRVPPGPLDPGARDTAYRLAAAGVVWQATAAGPLVRTAPPSPAAALERARARLALAAHRWLPPPEAALVRAIGAGDRAALDADTNRSFARSGLAHILAVSGMHLVVVIAGLQRLLLALLLRWPWLAERVEPRRGAAMILLPCAAGYALATGAGPPVVRAALACAVGLVGVLLDREGSALNGLALSAVALLALEPAAALDVSFQLSFAAVGGLVLWGARLREAIPISRADAGTWRARLQEPVLEAACATVAASLATAPILAFHFRQLPVLGLLANVAALPLGAGLTVMASLAGIAAAVSPILAGPFLLACWPLAAGLRALSDGASAPDWAVWGLASPGVAAALGAGALAVAAAQVRGWRWRVPLAGAALACLLLPGPLRAAAARARGGLEVLYLGVGQGDAALLRLPDGSAVLVDGGGASGGGADPGERLVVPLLRDLGVSRLAAVFVSHPHPDHVLGLGAVARAFPIERAFFSGDRGSGPVREVIEALHPEVLRAGQAWERAGVRFEVQGAAAGLGANDGSLVLRVVHGDVALLFPGDLEEAGERAAVARGGLRAEVVKVPHHGSRTSSSAPFVAAVGARLAVVSIGAGNRFGFPHAQPVARWRAAGASVLRTDQGAVRLLSNGRRLRLVPADTILDPLATWREEP